MCCSGDVSKGEGKKRRRILSNSGFLEILSSLLTELEIELDMERSNYLCRKCTEKLKHFKEKKEEILCLLSGSVSARSMEVPSSSLHFLPQGLFICHHFLQKLL